MAHAQKPDFVFRRNGRDHLNRRGRQFSQLLAAELCASAVVMLDAPCSEVVWRVLATHSIHQFPLHFPSRALPCAITFQQDSTNKIQVSVGAVQCPTGPSLCQSPRNSLSNHTTCHSALLVTNGFRTPSPNGTTTRTIKCLLLIFKCSDSLPAGDWISNYILQRFNWVYDVEWWGAVAIFWADCAPYLNEQWKLIVSACGRSTRTLCQTFPRHWRRVIQWKPIGLYAIFSLSPFICLVLIMYQLSSMNF